MQGRIIHVATDDADGLIRAENNQRYPYGVGDWVSLEHAFVGSSVDFEADDERAKSIYFVPDSTDTAPTGSAGMPLRKIPAFVIACVLLVAGIGGAIIYQTGLFSTLGSHGPLKTYSVTHLAKIRNLPTTQGSAVTGELQPGESYSGRVYLGPDGQSQWVKRDGADEYVSIINLVESESSQDSSVVAAQQITPGEVAAQPSVSQEDPDVTQIKNIWINAIASHCDAVGGYAGNPGRTSDCQNIKIVCIASNPVSDADIANGIEKKARLAVSLLTKITAPYSSGEGKFADMYIIGSFVMINGKWRQVNFLTPLGTNWDPESFRNEFNHQTCGAVSI